MTGGGQGRSAAQYVDFEFFHRFFQGDNMGGSENRDDIFQANGDPLRILVSGTDGLGEAGSS